MHRPTNAVATAAAAVFILFDDLQPGKTDAWGWGRGRDGGGTGVGKHLWVNRPSPVPQLVLHALKDARTFRVAVAITTRRAAVAIVAVRAFAAASPARGLGARRVTVAATTQILNSKETPHKIKVAW